MSQRFHLGELIQHLPERPGWSLVFGAACAEAAAICLDEQGHNAPTKLQIDGLTPCKIEIDWNPLDEIAVRFNADMEVATEYGAYAIAALLMPHLTGLTVIE
jgi:hypothetical protein